MTQYPSLIDFIKTHIRYKQHWNKQNVDMTAALWQSLKDDTFIQQWTFAKGSMFKCFETKNFGWIVFHPTAVLIDGGKPIRRIFKV